MSDLVKIREWTDADGPEPEEGWDFPRPDYCIESRIEGDLRRRILAKHGRDDTDPCTLRLIERDCEGGWSEYTSETWWDMEIWLDEGRQSRRIWESSSQWNQDNGVAALLKWIADPTPPTTDRAADGRDEGDQQ